MDDLTALLAAVVTHPDEDVPRLMYADALEERGNAALAAFIRRQCAPGYVSDWAEGQPRERHGHGFRLTPDQIAHQYTFPLARRVGWDDPHVCYSLTPREEVVSRIDVLFARGFASEIVCKADDFLRHADALFWHPTQTLVCPTCKGRGSRNPTARLQCLVCVNGRAPRPGPCPPTAQPIRRVVLTTRPGVEWGNLLSSGYDERECRLWGGTREAPANVTQWVRVPYLTHAQYAIDRIISAVAEKCWPGVRFLVSAPS